MKSMPTIKMFSVRDSAAQTFSQPIFAATTGVALRMFETAATDANHDFHRHAKDYELFELGEFNQSDGSYVALPVPVNLGPASQFIRPVDQVAKEDN
jgi:hypothetical protein